MKLILLLSLSVFTASALADSVQETIEAKLHATHSLVIKKSLTPDNCPNFKILGRFADVKKTIPQFQLHRYREIDDSSILGSCDYRDETFSQGIQSYLSRDYDFENSGDALTINDSIFPEDSPTSMRLMTTFPILRVDGNQRVRSLVPHVTFILHHSYGDDANEAQRTKAEAIIKRAYQKGIIEMVVMMKKERFGYHNGKFTDEAIEKVSEAIELVDSLHEKARTEKN